MTSLGPSVAAREGCGMNGDGGNDRSRSHDVCARLRPLLSAGLARHSGRLLVCVIAEKVRGLLPCVPVVCLTFP
eukprot:7379461-Prymnesium_polylepis.1